VPFAKCLHQRMPAFAKTLENGPHIFPILMLKHDGRKLITKPVRAEVDLLVFLDCRLHFASL
jgi:hypothetical protein